MLQYDLVVVDDHLRFVEELASIVPIKQFLSRDIPMVKVKWRYQLIKEGTCDLETGM